MIVKIKDLKKFDKLDFLISTTDVVSVILKMILVNSFNKKVILVNYLHNLLFLYMKKNKKRLI